MSDQPTYLQAATMDRLLTAIRQGSSLIQESDGQWVELFDTKCWNEILRRFAALEARLAEAERLVNNLVEFAPCSDGLCSRFHHSKSFRHEATELCPAVEAWIEILGMANAFLAPPPTAEGGDHAAE